MLKDHSSLGSCVVVVGDPGGALVQTTRRLAREGEIDAVVCDDVYSAVSRLAQLAGRRVLVVAALGTLAREGGAFFRIAARHAVRCGCLVAPGFATARRDLHAALEVGVTVLSDLEEIRGLLKKGLTPPSDAGPGAVPAARRAQRVEEELCEESRATEAELSALLG
jgi:hypothetical protein